ncbi:lipopeptide [Vibrio sp. V27_P1S3P104]|uniref:LPS translocon maturation chaperone LptM n=1 Tax=unclassified Vibrio TaxID=2614977 RepID=UPI000C16F09F|nr:MULTISPECIES: lipoprotein [Vibrio]NAW68951.1 lipopeptide [Vibrio sp. V28_P6S34P95]NAX03861.1 lipopeptide [Vibrio sp. V30_P3S12P165]NAX35018.1 lipopeptide [Vibrio sp. V29_P1S30P107]NAX38891.1 lipopeptide [Vibrio sp. V27_P1S3P104]NAX39838.1 lipopeptide [Vibrio sp. V26_P1S5P106]
MKFSFVHRIYPIAFLYCGAIIGGIDSIITICKMKKSVTALFLLSVLALAGCGQTGPLYLPDDTQQSEQSQ